MNQFLLMMVCVSFFSLQAYAAQVQPVPIPADASVSPQIEIDGVGIGTLGVGRTGEAPNTKSRINFSDTSIFVGASERLYDEAIGTFGIGGITTDQGLNAAPGTSFFLNRAYVDFQAQSFEVLLGRSDNPMGHLIDFPTLRDEDLLTVTNPLNPYSNGEHSEDHRFSNVASVSFNQGLSNFENLHVQHQINSEAGGVDSGVNSFGVSYEYLAPPGLENFERVSSFAFGFERYLVNSASSAGLNKFTAGTVINLQKSVTDLIDLRFQETLSLGSDLTRFQSANDTYQANAHQLAAALRFLHQPFGMPGYQLALTVGHKSYFKVSDSNSYIGALTGVKQLGHGFDLVAQYQGQTRSKGLALAQTNGVAYEQTFELGFVFNFGSTFNQHLSPRRSLLNQQHQYIPQ